MSTISRYRLTQSLVCLVLLSLTLTGVAHAAVHLTRTAPSPICLGQPFQIQGSFGSMPPKANVQIRPDTPKDNRILQRWRGTEIGWHADHLALNMPPTPIVPGTYRLVVEGSGVFEALRHVQIANCRKLPTGVMLEKPPTALKALPPAGKSIEPAPPSGKKTPQQIQPIDDPHSPAPGSLTPQATVPLNVKPQSKLPGGLTPQLKIQLPTIQSFQARAVGIHGASACDPQRYLRGDDPNAPVHAMIAFQTGDNVRKIVISAERVDGRLQPLWSRESASAPLPIADRDTSTRPLDLVLPWGTRQVILTATSTDGVEAHRNVELKVDVPLHIRAPRGLDEVIDSVNRSRRLTARIHYEGAASLTDSSMQWALQRIAVRTQQADHSPVNVFPGTLSGGRLTTGAVLWELPNSPGPTDVSEALIHATYQTPCNPAGGVSETTVPVHLVPAASRPPGV